MHSCSIRATERIVIASGNTHSNQTAAHMANSARGGVLEAGYYREQFDIEDSHWWYVGRRRVLRSLLRGFLPVDQPHQALEIGCGGGGNLSLLSEFSSQLTAVEMEPAAVNTAKQRRLGDIHQGKLGDPLQIFTQQYDLIGLFDVLEHIPDDQQALNQIKPLLSDRGQLFITVPAYPFLWTRHDEVAHHYRRYTQKALTDVLERSGYHVRYAGHFNTILFPPALVTLLAARALHADPGEAIKQPAAPVNALLKALFSFEAWLLPRWRFPFGLSIAAVAHAKH